ncbi:hypothetical protein SORBI_3001G093732 [Sorghum bicolor]|uniref:Uncharacterized protein n=1 Tax=Sorghum bicolor TaxID=4558 RepID=A0A1Z5S4Z4_SORBI|nr:hypothetical protein SORBI_3001G093732 [Sorghum bicolor]
MWTISWCQPLIRRADPGRIPPIRRNSDAIPRLPLFLRIKFLFTLFLASASRSSPPTSYFCCRLFACVFSASLVFFFVSSFLPTHLHLLSLSLSLSPTSPRRRLSPLPALLRLCGLACACEESYWFLSLKRDEISLFVGMPIWCLVNDTRGNFQWTG